MRSRALLVACFAIALSAGPVLAQTASTTGLLEGKVFLEDGTGGDGVIFVRAYTASTGAFVKGVCVDGLRFVIPGLQEGRYKVRFGVGCGGQADRPPYEWFDLEGGTDGIKCATIIIVSAGYTTDGIHATFNRQTGPRNSCGPAGTPQPGTAGVQRPIAGSTGIAASATPTAEISFTPGLKPITPPGTPVATIIGVSAGALAALGIFGVWLYRRVTAPSRSP